MVKTRIVPSQPALILDDKEKYLVITDLHIGFETMLLSNDIHVEPKEIITEIHGLLDEIIKTENPDNLILLGDIKSGIGAISRAEWNSVPLFFEIGKRINTIIVPGNHDGNLQRLLPNGITITSPTGLVLDDVLLTHGHVMPSENLSYVNKIVMGHVHPTYFQEGSVLHGQRVWISMKADKNKIFPSVRGEIEVIIIPSFNKYFYATHKKLYKKSISPILECIKKPNSAKVVTLDGSIIGDEAMMPKIL